MTTMFWGETELSEKTRIDSTIGEQSKQENCIFTNFSVLIHAFLYINFKITFCLSEIYYETLIFPVLNLDLEILI